METTLSRAERKYQANRAPRVRAKAREVTRLDAIAHRLSNVIAGANDGVRDRPEDPFFAEIRREAKALQDRVMAERQRRYSEMIVARNAEMGAENAD
jgi:hypothetical protein